MLSIGTKSLPPRQAYFKHHATARAPPRPATELARAMAYRSGDSARTSVPSLLRRAQFSDSLRSGPLDPPMSHVVHRKPSSALIPRRGARGEWHHHGVADDQGCIIDGASVGAHAAQPWQPAYRLSAIVDHPIAVWPRAARRRGPFPNQFDSPMPSTLPRAQAPPTRLCQLPSFWRQVFPYCYDTK